MYGVIAATEAAGTQTCLLTTFTCLLNEAAPRQESLISVMNHNSSTHATHGMRPQEELCHEQSTAKTLPITVPTTC